MTYLKNLQEKVTSTLKTGNAGEVIRSPIFRHPLVTFVLGGISAEFYRKFFINRKESPLPAKHQSTSCNEQALNAERTSWYITKHTTSTVPSVSQPGILSAFAAFIMRSGPTEAEKHSAVEYSKQVGAQSDRIMKQSERQLQESRKLLAASH